MTTSAVSFGFFESQLEHTSTRARAHKRKPYDDDRKNVASEIEKAIVVLDYHLLTHSKAVGFTWNWRHRKILVHSAVCFCPGKNHRGNTTTNERAYHKKSYTHLFLLLLFFSQQWIRISFAFSSKLTMLSVALLLLRKESMSLVSFKSKRKFALERYRKNEESSDEEDDEKGADVNSPQFSLSRAQMHMFKHNFSVERWWFLFCSASISSLSLVRTNDFFTENVHTYVARALGDSSSLLLLLLLLLSISQYQHAR